MHVLRRQVKYMHINFLPDRIFLLNHNEERSMMMISPALWIKIHNISLKINKLNLFKMVLNCLISKIFYSKCLLNKKFFHFLFILIFFIKNVIYAYRL